MKTLKLEVGKTYRSREGNEVKIIGKDRGVRCLYKGSDGGWYTESGRWRDFDIKNPLDLIEEVEEVTKTRHTFSIPDGVKKVTVEQVGNRIVVEMVPEDKDPEPVDVKFKEGDIVFEDGRIMIIKKHPNLYRALIHGSPDYLHVDGSYGVPFTSAAFRLATAEEAKPLFNALKKAGKRWNAETMEVEDVSESTRIREWVEEHLDEEDVAEAIEAYLKYREGEK